MENNKVYNYTINYGMYWPVDADIYSIGVEFIMNLLYEEKIKGSTYIEVMSTEFGIETYGIYNLFCKDALNALKYINYVEIIDSEHNIEAKPIDNIELEFIKNTYINKINSNKLDEYDNVICVIEDEPPYSENNCSTTTIMFISNSKNFIINFAYPQKNKYDISYDINEDDLIKKIKKLV